MMNKVRETRVPVSFGILPATQFRYRKGCTRPREDMVCREGPNL